MKNIWSPKCLVYYFNVLEWVKNKDYFYSKTTINVIEFQQVNGDQELLWQFVLTLNFIYISICQSLDVYLHFFLYLECSIYIDRISLNRSSKAPPHPHFHRYLAYVVVFPTTPSSSHYLISNTRQAVNC